MNNHCMIDLETLGTTPGSAILSIAGVKPNRGEGTHHYALDDAINQAHAVQEAYRKLNITEGV